MRTIIGRFAVLTVALAVLLGSVAVGVAKPETFLAKAREVEKRSRTFHDAVLKHESLSGDNLGLVVRAKPPSSGRATWFAVSRIQVLDIGTHARRRSGAHHPRFRRASGAHRINGVGRPLVLALHPLPAGHLAIAR